MNVKYQIKEFTPAQNQKGVHSFYAEAVVNQVLTMQDIAKRVGENTAFKQYEAQVKDWTEE